MTNVNTKQAGDLRSVNESADPTVIFERTMSLVEANTRTLTDQIDQEDYEAALHAAAQIVNQWIEGCSVYQAISSFQQRSRGPIRRMAFSLLLARRRAILDQLVRLTNKNLHICDDPERAELYRDSAMELKVTVELSVETSSPEAQQ